jgi:hypothetical protein
MRFLKSLFEATKRDYAPNEKSGGNFGVIL